MPPCGNFYEGMVIGALAGLFIGMHIGIQFYRVTEKFLARAGELIKRWFNLYK